MKFKSFLAGMLCACATSALATLGLGGSWGYLVVAVIATSFVAQILYLALIFGLVVARTRKEERRFDCREVEKA